ncbi:MAG: tetratricopeptide repeat protein [Geobacteraceae bacterium]|nr:tetratricopeptide repeat protein [Geobacteraceae bacterium]
MTSPIRSIFQSAVIAAGLTGLLSGPAEAVQWRTLAETSRYQVAIDEESIRLTPLGRLAVWLRFVPKGESQRRAAAADYGENGYRSHLEFYEIDCSEKNAVLTLIDIFGASKTRLKRMRGGLQPDAIIPGSALDRAAERICPAIDEEALDEEDQTPDPEPEQLPEATSGRQLSEEMKQNILELTKRTQAEPDSLEAWRLLGNAYFDADLPEQSIEAYGRALAIKPDDTDILNDQGAMYRQTGEFRKALANFEKAFKLDPGNLESLYNSGYVHAFDLNDIPRALKLWRQYLQLDRSSDTARQVQSFVERYQDEQKQP